MEKLDTELIFAMAKAEKHEAFPLWWQCVATLYKQSGKPTLKYVKAFRRALRKKMMRTVPGKTPFNEANDLMRKTYILTGKDYFEDFMIAMEYDRAKDARFWLPRRKVLEGTFHIASSLQRFMDDDTALFLALMMPPGTGKTTLIKFLLAYIAGKYPESCNMYISYGKGMVDVMYSSALSMLTDSEYNFADIFPDVPTLKTSGEYKTLSYRPDGTPPTLGLVALGGAVTGRTRANKFFITDDLVKNAELARSPERLMSLYQDYTTTLTTRKIGDSVKEIMLGTPWSLHDPIMTNKEKHEKDAGYYFMAFPVCDDNGHSNFCYDHPDRYTDETVKQLKKNQDDYTFSALYLMQPLEKAGALFAPDNLRYYNGTLPEEQPDNILFAADVAWGGGDYFSMPIACQYGHALYVPDVIYTQDDATKTKPRVVEKIMYHKIMMGQFEANTGGNEYCEDITKRLKELNIHCSLTAKRAASTQKKLAKIEQYMPDIREIYFLSPKARENMPEYNNFMRDLHTFSFIGNNLHDDAPDSLAQLIDFAFFRYGSARAIVRDKATLGLR